MALDQDGEPVALQTFDQIHLPERLLAVQGLGEDPVRQGDEFPLGARRGKGRVTHVEGDVEGVVIDPERPADVHRRVGQPLPIPRNQGKTRLDVGHEVPVGRSLAVEYEHGTDVHVAGLVLVRQERGIEACQPVHVR